MKIKTKIGVLALALVFFWQPVLAELSSDSHLGPNASFTASPTATVTGNPVSFDASISRDARGSTNLKYRWDFEGRYNWTSWSSSPRATYAFPNEGNFAARLQVKDADGLVDETAASISVATKRVSSAPFAEIHVSPEVGDTSTNFHFTVEVFSNLHTPTDQLEVRWDWNHDGKWDTTWSRAREFFHTFPEALWQEVWLEVRDTDGSSSIEKGFYLDDRENDSVRTKEIGRILVQEATAPLASFETWPVEIDQNTLVHFDASDSIRAAEFRWDFDGNGRFDNSWSSGNRKVQHVFPNVGAFEVILEARNSLGEVDRTTRMISVTDSKNILPEANFTVRNLTNSVLGSRTAVLRDEVRFNAGGSRDEDGSISKLSVRWDFEGDGIFDTTFSTDKVATHRYTETGLQKPILQVRDERGGLASAKAEIEVVANTAPRAVLKISPALGNPETTFRFDASDSRDDQTGTSNLTYRFDFDGDGIFDTKFSSSRSYSKKISQLGKLAAKVEVRDHANAVAVATAVFEVAQPVAPGAAFVVVPRVGTFGTNFEFNASATTDPTGVGGPLSYRWDFDYHGASDVDFSTGWSSSPIYRHRFTEIGDHQIHLVVKNSIGQQSDFFTKIKIHSDSLAFQFLRQKGLLAEDGDPEALITRAELAQLVVRAAKISASVPRTQQFTDVPTSDQNSRYIAAASVRGWISPRQNFAWQPDGLVNRAEAAKVVISALYPKIAELNSVQLADVPESAWYARFAETAVAENLLTISDHKFNPAASVSRAEVVRMIAILIDKYPIERRYAHFFETNHFAAAETSSSFEPSEFFASLLQKIGLTD
ncbi:MAG: PKD domain-containing protein [Patescibacteria group bacterium]